MQSCKMGAQTPLGPFFFGMILFLIFFKFCDDLEDQGKNHVTSHKLKKKKAESTEIYSTLQ